MRWTTRIFSSPAHRPTYWRYRDDTSGGLYKDVSVNGGSTPTSSSVVVILCHGNCTSSLCVFFLTLALARGAFEGRAQSPFCPHQNISLPNLDPWKLRCHVRLSRLVLQVEIGRFLVQRKKVHVIQIVHPLEESQIPGNTEVTITKADSFPDGCEKCQKAQHKSGQKSSVTEVGAHEALRLLF